MKRPVRFAVAALLIGVSLLLPVLLRGQSTVVVTQAWGPGTPAGRPPAAVIASTSRGTPGATGEPADCPPLVPLVDDGLKPPAPPRSALPPAVETLPIQPVGHEEPASQPPGVPRMLNLKPLVPVETTPLATTPGTNPGPAVASVGPLNSISTSVLSIEVLGPPRVAVDDLLPVELVVRNLGEQVITGVRLELPLPTGVHYAAGNPAPEVQPEQLTWTRDMLAVRGEWRVRVDLLVKGVGEVALQPRASYATGAPYRPQVVRPLFAVDQTAPDAVPRGATATLTIRLTNHGPVPLGKVVVSDQLPAGLLHPQGASVRTDVGTLAPGESRQIRLDMRAARLGRWINEVVAEAEGGVRTVSRAAVVVVEPSLTVRVQAPDRVAVADTVEYRLEVLNGRQGPPARDVRLTLALPEGLELLQTTEGQVDPLTRRVAWLLGALEPGQMQTVFLKARCVAPGPSTVRASLAAARQEATTAEHVLVGEGGCRLRLDVQGREERLEVDGETVYEARLTNLAAEPARNVRLSAWVPEGVAPVRAEGPPGLGVRIQQQQVLFDPLPQVAGHGVAVYRIRVRGQQAGAWRLRVEGAADQMVKPLLDEVALTVHPDPRRRVLPGLLDGR